jgi:hypothetical protein
VSARARLPNRRQSETLDFEHGGHWFSDDGRAEAVLIAIAGLAGLARKANA